MFLCHTCTVYRSCTKFVDVGSLPLDPGVAFFFSACGMNVHHRCQTKVANLCGINQKLMAEALAMIESTQQVGKLLGDKVWYFPFNRDDSISLLLDLGQLHGATWHLFPSTCLDPDFHLHAGTAHTL